MDPDKRNDIKEALYYSLIALYYVKQQFVEKTQDSNIVLDSTLSSTFQNVDTFSGNNVEDDFLVLIILQYQMMIMILIPS